MTFSEWQTLIASVGIPAAFAVALFIWLSRTLIPRILASHDLDRAEWRADIAAARESWLRDLVDARAQWAREQDETRRVFRESMAEFRAGLLALSHLPCRVPQEHLGAKEQT